MRLEPTGVTDGWQGITIARRLSRKRVMSIGDSTCDNELPKPESKTPIETRLVKSLRLWRADPSSVATNDRTVEQEICALLEWYICECIPYGPSNLGGWWSDGVIHLEIQQTAPEVFKLVGVTWIDCHGVTPFEIDVELVPTNDRNFAKTIFRIGMLEDGGCPKLSDSRMDARRLLAMRPQQNGDWAMAVELTPTGTK
jgi:hypothetical protein